MPTFLRVACDRAILVGGVKVAAVVGTVLNAINQGDRLMTLRFDDVAWWRLGLTYLVPFCVSVFSATRMRMSFPPDSSKTRRGGASMP